MRWAKGMTLLEMMLAAALVGLVGLTFAAIYGSVQRYFIQDVNLTYTQGEAGHVIQHIQTNVLPALAIISVSSGSVQGFVYRYDLGGFDFPVEDLTDDRWAGYWIDTTDAQRRMYFKPLIVDATGTVINGAAQPTQADLTRIEAAAPSEIIARGVIPTTTIDATTGNPIPIPIFQVVSPALLKVTLTVSQGNGGNQRTSSIASSFSPRGVNPVP